MPSENENIIVRIPLKFHPLWNRIRREISEGVERSSKLAADGLVKHSVVLEKLLIDHTRRDYHQLSANLEKMLPEIKKIKKAIAEVNSTILTYAVLGK